MGNLPATTLTAALTLTALTLLLALLTGCGSTSNTTTTTTTASAANTPSSTTRASASTTRTATTTAASTTSAPAGTARTATSKPVEEVAPTVEKVKISSPAFAPEKAIPARYTCDGQNTSPPLRWGGIPSGTKELMLDIIKIKPVNGKLYFPWAITGLKPTSHGLNPGQLPPGVIVGANSAGHTTYDLCPPKGPREEYLAALFALRYKLPATSGFDAAALRREALSDAKYEGFLNFTYQRH